MAPSELVLMLHDLTLHGPACPLPCLREIVEVIAMNEALINERIMELAESLTGSPKLGMGQAGSEGVYQPASSAGKLTVEDSLDYLRLQVKYLLFDLEATRRENRYLRQMLDSRSNRKPEQEGEDENRWR